MQVRLHEQSGLLKPKYKPKRKSVGQIIWTVTDLILLQVIMEKGVLAHPLSSWSSVATEKVTQEYVYILIKNPSIPHEHKNSTVI